MRRFSRAAVFVVVAFCYLGLASRADAHAELESTVPANGAALSASPASISITFGENVEISLGSLQLYDSTGDRVTTSAPKHPSSDSRTVVVSPGKLKDGTYVASWHVISSDSHPVGGAFTFAVGNAAPTSTDWLTNKLTAAQHASRALGVTFGAIRFAIFAALIVTLGGALFLIWLWPRGWLQGRARNVIWCAWIVALAATALGVCVQGAYAGGLPLSSAFAPKGISEVLDTRYGHAALARLILLLIFGLIIKVGSMGVGRPSLLRFKIVAAIVAIGALAPLSASGHDATGSMVPWTLTSDLIHLSSVTVWLGGLVMLSAVFLKFASDEEIESVAPKFSNVAFIAVCVILATGTFQGWRQVGSWGNLTGTPYGQIFLVKLAFFAAIIAVASWSRRSVRNKLGVAVAGLRRAVRFEVAIAVAILIATSLLVDAVPARIQAAKPFSAELTTGPLLVDASIDPAKVGYAEMHFYVITQAGELKDVPEFTAQIVNKSRNIGPIDIPLTKTAAGHYTTDSYQLPLAGKWELDVSVRTSDIDSYKASTNFSVSGR